VLILEIKFVNALTGPPEADNILGFLKLRGAPTYLSGNSHFERLYQLIIFTKR